MLKAVQLTLRGRVQGVGMRYWVRTQAKRFGLNGWVRNEPDHSVRVWVEGESAAVDGFVASCEAPWLGGRPGYLESVGKLDVSMVGASGFETRWR